MSATTDTETAPVRPKVIRARRNRRLLLVALALLTAACGYGWTWWTYDRHWVRTDNAYVTGNLVPVEAQASGIITHVLAEETQFVHRGDLLIRLDEHEAYAAVGRARGHLGETVRRITALFVRRRQLAEKLEARKARLELVEHDLARYRQASPTGAVSKQIVENAVDKIRELQAEVRETQAELDALDAEVGGTSVMEHPAVELAKHELIETSLAYQRQRIHAPVSGYVAKRKAQVGDRVKPGTVLMTIVPLDHLWVEANLRETEMRRVRPGQPALVTVDLHGSEYTFHGTVEGLVPGTGSVFAMLPPDNATGNFIHIVERVPVRIALPQDEIREHPIRPGLSTVTAINVAESGQSVWTSLARPDTAEYETDIFAEELAEAESIAQEIIEANVVTSVLGRAAMPGVPADAPSNRHDVRAAEAIVRAVEASRRPGDVGDDRRRPPQSRPGSHVPPRSPDLGAHTQPLTPSIGPGSNSLGPEAGAAGRSPRSERDERPLRRGR